MGIHWNTYGWDCPDCGAYDGLGGGLTLHDASPEVYAGMTKRAADHARECSQLIGDLRESGAYNRRVSDPLPSPDDYNPFEYHGQPVEGLPTPNTKQRGSDLRPSDKPILAPETIMDGIERILADDLPHAQKQATVKPHENYRLRPEDRTDGHPERPR